jgi:hypothetical protein
MIGRKKAQKTQRGKFFRAFCAFSWQKSSPVAANVSSL